MKKSPFSPLVSVLSPWLLTIYNLLSLINMKIMIVVKEINRIMYVVIIVNRHGCRWVLDMMRWIMHNMNMIHWHRLPYRSHSWSSFSLISVSIVASALAKGFPHNFPIYYWGLESDILSLPFFSYNNLLSCGHSTYHNEGTNGKFYCSCVRYEHILPW